MIGEKGLNFSKIIKKIKIIKININKEKYLKTLIPTKILIRTTMIIKIINSINKVLTRDK